MCTVSGILLIVSRQRTSEMNKKREGSRLLEFEDCFEVGDNCNSMIV